MDLNIAEIIKKNNLSKEEALSLMEKTEKLLCDQKTDVNDFEGGDNQLSKKYLYNEPLLKDHLIFNEQVLMGVAHLSLQLDFIRQVDQHNDISLKKVFFLSAAKIKQNDNAMVSVSGKNSGGRLLLSNHFSASPSGATVETANSQYCKSETPFEQEIDIESLKQKATETRSGKIFYKHKQQETYGPSLFNVRKVWDLGKGILAEIKLTETMVDELPGHYIHPSVFDACHVASSYVLGDDPLLNHQVPFLIKEGTFRHNITQNDLEHIYCFVEKVLHNDQIAEMNIVAYDLAGNALFKLTGFTTKKIQNSESFLNKAPKATKSETETETAQPVAQISSTIDGPLKDKIQHYLLQKMAPIINKKPDDLSIDNNFMDMGFDSNNMVEVVQAIEREVGIELYPTLFFENQNIVDLVKYFESEHADAFSGFLGGPGDLVGPAMEAQIEEKLKSNDYKVLTAERSNPFTDYNSIKGKKEHEDIAIIGMSGYFAESANLDEFWNHIEASRDLVTEIPKDHWDYQPWFDANRNAENKTYSKWGSFLRDIDKFDPMFFGQSPRQSDWMDPQLRLLLQSVQETIEDAGVAGQIKGSKTGVYVGCCFQEYWDEIVRAQIPLVDYQHNSSAMSSLSGMVSYVFDFQGGSIPLDNACASSLTALHLGCRALMNEECETAIIAGINILLSPLHYVYFSRLQALSPTGRCHTFDKKADGYVPGEGIVSVLIKPLSKAIEAGDNIHAVVKGTGINHVGRSNNPTSPRPELQTKLVLDTWENANIGPETISYIEAHGTGTSLGDPIEINALKKAFQKHTDKTGFCAIGSTKAHIGHLEGAAGLAGLIKVVLSMKHKTIPKMPNFEEINPYIKLENSPLYVNDKVMKWETASGIPRRAGVSSFGMTGNNAHAVIEEYIVPSSKLTSGNINVNSPALVPLSARNETRLKAYAEKLAVYLRNHAEDKNKAVTELLLKDIAYTLQIGREAMEERIVFLVRNINELVVKLDAFVAGENRIDNCYQGRAKMSNDAVSVFTVDEDIKEAIDKWIVKGKVKKLAELWAKGLELDWSLLYGEEKPRRISLPAYAFAKERCWIPLNDDELRGKKGELAHLHPLLHVNISNLETQQFSSKFTGQEFFLKDHKVQETKILPGVAYLEMARAAGELSSLEKVTHIKNIVWASPISINGNYREVKISLYPENEYISYEVHTSNSAEEIVVHSQGKLVTGPNKKSGPESINIDELQTRCKTRFSAKECYERFAKSGLNYGPTFQGIQELYVGENEAFSRIKLPETVIRQEDNFDLHPSLMDAALQTTIGLITDEEGMTFLPFALKELNIRGKLPDTAFVYTRYSKGVGPTGNVIKFDIDITDEAGVVCVSLKEFTVRLYSLEEKDGADDVLYATFEWQEEEGKRQKDKGKSAVNKGKVFLLGVNKDNEEELKKELPELKVEQLIAKNDASSIIQNFQTVFKYIRENLKIRPKEISSVLVVVQGETNKYLAAMFSGLFKTARIENPKICGKFIEIGPGEGQLSQIIKSELGPGTFDEVEVRYSEGMNREVKKLKEVKFEDETDNSNLIKEGGVYWITGGLGGLGRIFTEHLSKTKDVKVILSGRSELDKAKQTQLKTLRESGITVEYIQGDVSSRDEVERVVRTIKEKHNQLNGIIHSAGVIKDAFIIKKTENELEAVFKPKVSGILNIDEITKNDKLDFVVLFSSISGAIGNAGQSDYSGANAFLDAYAEYRTDLVKSGKRSGKTISINWQLWRDGGMQIDETSEQMMLRTFGMRPLSTQTGLLAFDKLLAQNSCLTAIVVTGNISKIKEVLKLSVSNIDKEKLNDVSSTEKISVDHNQIESELSAMFCGLLNLKKEHMDMETDFSDYGVDSIVMMKALNLLEEKYGTALEPTAIAQYPTIKELANFMIESGIAKTETNSSAQSIKTVVKTTEKPVSILKTKRGDRFRNNSYSTGKTGKIAIISQTCRLPKSQTIEKFWENLKNGKDLITTVPEDRWNSKQFYSPDRSNPNTSYTNHGGFIDGIGYFDSKFFGIPDHEALTMDPQQRIMLELTQELIDRAGYRKEEISQTRTCVYIGAKDNNYIRNNYHLMPESALQHIVVNSISNMIAARVSDFYNLTGESKVVDTACSSSLVAIHDACKSILSGESEMAIAGGIFFMMDPFTHIGFSKAQVLSEDGKSYVFDERAEGFVLGEGAGLVMLKDYDAAIRDQDRISAVILGSAVNNDGKTMGVTVPNQAGQKAVIQSAIEMSGITPDTIGYLEAHGTGTLLGDPIEIKAASEVYKDYTNKNSYCAVGSVKSNLGHTMTAAGISSLIKVILSLQNQQIPATLNCEKPHPRFMFEETPFYPNTQLKPWGPIEGKRRAAISSFGFGGTNCHMILEEWLQKEQPSYRPRQSLPPTIFNRKWYWFGDSMTPEFDVSDIPERPIQKEKVDISATLTGNNELEDYLTAKVAAILNVGSLKDIDRHGNFMEMGIDSVQLVKFSGELETEIGIELYPTLFFEYQNLYDLAKFLSGKYGNQIKSFFNITYAVKQEPEQTIIVRGPSKKIIRRTEKKTFAWTNLNINDRNQIRKLDSVAIVGISGRFPGSPDLTTFWKNLEDCKDLIAEIPEDRWDWREYWGETGVNKTKAKWGGFIKDIDKFDSLFFNISPREAELMDPQQRIFMQCVWQAIEDAGYKPGDLSGTNTGLFVGVASSDYFELLRESDKEIHAQTSTGSAHSILANRISYLLNIHGPSEPIDTACSSSLIAIHRAVEGIQNGSMDMAICGGVNALLSPTLTLSFSKAGMLSEDGRCKTFDKRANGYVRGEGVGVVFLKSLSRAKEDGDHIYGIIKGTAENHGGKANSLTAPNPKAQKELLITAYEKAGVDPGSIGYIEAHGTGTELGDPIEINGLKGAFEELYKRNDISHINENSCAIGSVKTNIGHLETAAGIAGVLKVLLSIKNGKLPGNPHLKEQNPYIDLKGSPFYLLRETEEWKRKNDGSGSVVPRRAGVSSFGFGGANAHIVIEEYIEEKRSKPLNITIDSVNPIVIPLSAKSGERLKDYAQELVNYLTVSVTGKPNNAEKSNNGLKDKVAREITTILSKLVSMENEEIEHEEGFVELGIDQVALGKLHENLEESWSFTIEPKIVAQSININDLSDNLINKYSVKLSMAYGCEGKIEEASEELPIKSSINSISLIDLAYTLQIGREAMEKRVVFLVEDTKELIDKLEAYVSGQESIVNCYQGKVKNSVDSIGILATDEDSKEMVSKWISKGKVIKLAKLWIKGLEFDWSLLYGEKKPRRISAPTYPFANERHWIDQGAGVRSQVAERERKLHPLVHINTSDLNVQQFSSTFTGQEFFLSDHKIKNEKILPGVAYLEMARVAGELASKEKVTYIEDIVWAKPISVNGNMREVKISLYPENDHIAYEVHTSYEELTPVIHSQGRIIVESVRNSETKSINIKEIQTRCKKKITSAECYNRFGEIGLNYGFTFQGINELYVGTTEILGQIELPETETSKREMFQLHPSLMDAALQTTIGLSVNDNVQIMLPFALKKLSIINKLPTKAFAYVRHCRGVDSKNDVVKFDIVITDMDGKVCVSLEEFAVRALNKKDDKLDEIMYVPQWVRKREEIAEADIKIAEGKSIVIFDKEGYGFEKEIIKQEKDVIAITLGNKNKKENNCPVEIDGQDANAFEMLFDEQPKDITNVYFLSALSNKYGQSHACNEQEEITLGWFRCIKALIRHGYAQKKLNIVVLTQDINQVTQKDKVNARSSGLSGLTQSLAKEYPNWNIKSIDISSKELKQKNMHGELYEAILKEAPSREGNSVSYRDGYRYEQEILPLLVPCVEESKFRKEGVYVILGGAGGLGVGFSEYLIKTYNAQMIWIGRRACDDKISESIADLEKFGKPPIYIQADTTNIESTRNALTQIKLKVSEIHGVIHSALVLKDQSLDKMSEEVFRSGLDPKINGSVNLVEVFKHEKLDWLCFFSSAQSVMGAPGQSNYAAGCTFQDSYAHSLRAEVKFPILTINWGFWGDIGVVATEYYREQMAKLGIFSLDLAEGVEILERSLSYGLDQAIIIKAAKSTKEKIGINQTVRIKIYPIVEESVFVKVVDKLPNRTKEVDKLRENYCGQLIEEFALRGLLQSLQKLGWEETAAFEDIQKLKSHLGIQDKYESWLKEIVRVLTENGMVKSNQDKIKAFDIEKEALELVQNHPDTKAQVELLKDCLENLVDIVTGKRLATDILFPNTSMEKVLGIYKDNPIADFYNETVADVIETYVQSKMENLNGDEKINILEVGAGTGGTSAFIFKRLTSYSDIIEYTFTDISKSFLMRAEEVYKEKAPYLKTALFNVEIPLAGQSIESNTYDVVIGANVLHATKNMVNTLDQVKMVLKQNGILVINELSQNNLFATLTFGLTDGWWLFEDDEIRLPGSPGLSYKQWERVLAETGFRNTMCCNFESQAFGQQVIIAESLGFSRQKVQIESTDMDSKVNNVEIIASRQAEQRLNLEYTRQLKNNLSQCHLSIEGHSTSVQNQNTDSTLVTNETINEKVKNIVLEQISKALKLSKNSVELNKPLSDFGVDSIIGVELIREINKELKLDLSTIILFDYPTVDKLVDYICHKNHNKIVFALDNKCKKSNEVPEYSTELVNETIPSRFLRKDRGGISLDQLALDLMAGRLTVEKAIERVKR